MGGGRFSDGFLVGALIGGAAVFLLGTKKGNKILNAITEEGIAGLSDLVEEMEEREVVPRAEKKVAEIVEDVKEKVEEKLEPEPPTPKTKRFFKKR